jgi:hypothetical protein
MNHPFGPWATLITAGRHPQLSAFWRRRLRMLIPVSRSRPALSRRNVFWLAIAALLICLLPTFRAAPAVAQQQKPAAVSPSNVYHGNTAIHTTGDGVVTTYNSVLLPEPMMAPSHLNSLVFPFYWPLIDDRNRAELRLSGEQEQKLKELSRKYVAEFRPNERKIIREFEKATADSPAEEKNRKMDEMWTKIRQAARPVRRQVEALLTPAQLARLRMLALLDRPSPSRLLYDLKAGLTDEQKAERERLIRLEQQFLMEGYEKLEQADHENDAKAIAILTAAQREQLERQVLEADVGMPMIFGQQLDFQFTIPPGVGHVCYPPLWELRKDLGLSAEQLGKLDAISVNSQPSQALYKLFSQPPNTPSKSGNADAKGGADQVTGTAAPPKETHGSTKAGAGNLVLNGNNMGSARAIISASANGGTSVSGGTLSVSARCNGEPDDMPRLTPQLEQRMRQPEFRQRVEDLKRQLRQQIDAVLTPQQLATLRRLALQKAVARRARDPEIPADLHPTQRQKTEMYRLFAARAETQTRIYRESREKFVGTLSPQERQKCLDALDRQEWKPW